jgi:hypothetical protein
MLLRCCCAVTAPLWRTHHLDDEAAIRVRQEPPTKTRQGDGARPSRMIVCVPGKGAPPRGKLALLLPALMKKDDVA